MSKALDLCDPAILRAVARRVGLVPDHGLGQNFLVDRAVLDDIVAALDPAPSEQVFEVGPGMGTLTGELAARAGRVVAMDIDERCVRATRITQRHRDNLVVVQGDAVRVDPAAWGLGEGWLAAGNLPYQVTTALLSRLFELSDPPRRAVFLVQREVAARLAASAGDWSLATVAVRSVASVERLRDVAPQSFDPPPRVHSSIVRLRPARGLEGDERTEVLELARQVFQMRRKTLRHGITHAASGDQRLGMSWLERAEVDPHRRPGTLDLEEWHRIALAARTLPAQP